jgi:hypothetical protein
MASIEPRNIFWTSIAVPYRVDYDLIDALGHEALIILLAIIKNETDKL